MIRDKPLHNFLFETDPSGFYRNLDTWCTPWIDVCCLLHLIRFHKPRTLLEIGTHKGYTTRILAGRFPDMSIVTVDPGNSVPDKERPENQKGEYLPKDQVGMLVSGMSNVEVIKRKIEDVDFSGRKFDFIFVDGNHQFEHVLSSSKIAFSLVNTPGTIVWHDFNNVKEVNSAILSMNTPSEVVWIHNTWIAYHDTH